MDYWWSYIVKDNTILYSLIKQAYIAFSFSFRERESRVFSEAYDTQAYICPYLPVSPEFLNFHMGSYLT